jgi:hypothetical protein
VSFHCCIIVALLMRRGNEILQLCGDTLVQSARASSTVPAEAQLGIYGCSGHMVRGMHPRRGEFWREFQHFTLMQFTQILGRRPLFPGRSYADQMKIIFSITGAPPASQVRLESKRALLNNQFC